MARLDTLRSLRLLLLALLAVAICHCPATLAPPVAAETANLSPGKESLHRDYALAFQRISLEQGLSQSSVNCIFQDGKGYLWFGTSDGLNRYDGHGFVVYEHDLEDPFSLSDDLIYSIYQDRDGALWVGTQNGLNKFDRATGRFTHFRSTPGDAKSLSHNVVWAIYEDQSGTLWVGTANGLDWLDRDKGDFRHFAPKALGDYYEVRAIHGDPSGAIWIGTDQGLVKFNQERVAVAYYQNDFADSGSLSHDSVRSIYQGLGGALWVGTDHGLNKFDSASETFTRYRYSPRNADSLGHDAVYAIHEDQTGALWIGTLAGGLDRFDPETGRFAHFQHDPQHSYSLSSNEVRSVYVDREGTLWVGTLDGGVNKADIGRRIAHYKNDPQNRNSLVHNTVWAFYQDRTGALWIATADGVDRLDRESGKFTHYRHSSKDENSLSDNYVRAIYADQAGQIWFGTRSGLDRLDQKTGKFTHYRHDSLNPPTLSHNEISAIIQDPSGVLWVGTRGGGLNRFEPHGESIKVYWAWPDPNGLSGNFVNVIYEDRAGMLWIGSDNGLDMLDPRTEHVVSYQHAPDDAHSLSSNLVQSIHEDRAGTLWVGTYQGGLNKLDRETGVFVHYGRGDGLPNDAVYGILEDSEGYLWLSTNQGLSRFDPRAEVFVNYDVRDGLQSNEFNGGAYYQNSSGEMFFGGINGFNAFYPELMKKGNSYVPPVVLTLLTQGGEPVDVGQAHDSLAALTLQWPNNFFEFEFAALSYAQPEKNQHAYKLEGFDEQWNEIGARNFGRYTNLPSGTYTLRLIGSNNAGVWNEQGVSVRVVVAPPFWGTWWFQGAVVLLLVGGAVGAYRWRVRSIEAHSRELEAQVQQRTAELRQEMAQRARAEEALRQSEMDEAVAAERNRLARELHDAVTQTLFSASLIAEVLPRLWQADPEKGRQQLEEVRLLTRGALAEMRALLIELRPGALAKANMRDLLGQLGRAMTGRTGVPVTVVAQDECAIPPAVQLAFYRIAQEALNNVAKHADATQVQVEFCCEAGRVRLSIGDDGRGFDVHGVPPGHFGLGIMRERAAAIGADFRLESEPGKGTRVRVDWGEERGWAELTDGGE